MESVLHWRRSRDKSLQSSIVVDDIVVDKSRLKHSCIFSSDGWSNAICGISEARVWVKWDTIVGGCVCHRSEYVRLIYLIAVFGPQNLFSWRTLAVIMLPPIRFTTTAFHSARMKASAASTVWCQFFSFFKFFHSFDGREATEVLFKSGWAEIWIFFWLGITFCVGITSSPYAQPICAAALTKYISRAKVFFSPSFVPSSLAASPLLSSILFLILPICRCMRYNKCLFYIC